MPPEDLKELWRRADGELQKKLPLGVTLVRVLRGHTAAIGRIAWSPDGQMLASPSTDMTIRLWNAYTGECLRTLEGHENEVDTVTFDPTGRTLASGSRDNTVRLWEVESGRLLRTLNLPHGVSALSINPQGQMLASGGWGNVVMLWDLATGALIRTLEGHNGIVYDLTFDPSGSTLVSASYDKTLKVWEPSNGRLVRTLDGHSREVIAVAFDPAGDRLASGSFDGTINVWEPTSGRLLRTLEGHLSAVSSVSFSADNALIASKSLFQRRIYLWHTETGNCIAELAQESVHTDSQVANLVFHPHLPVLAAVGSDPFLNRLASSDESPQNVIHLYKLNLLWLLDRVPKLTAHYVNAKVVLVGDTGVGKTGLSVVLNNQPYKETDSTAGRHVWTFASRDVRGEDNVMRTRETLMWDLAGQPGYRIIHQLHLNEVAVALVVFDSRSETDPLAGVRHWERALRLAQQRQGRAGVPMKKLLVSARNDRGGISVSKDRINAFIEEFNFEGYFETSAKEGWKIKELRAAIEQSIPWKDLPEVSSSQLFADIKSFLLEVKKTGRLLSPSAGLYDELIRERHVAEVESRNLRSQFETCIGRLENRDLIRRLSFGEYVLLQPELLDAYASAMVNRAKEEPDGLGSIAEEAALAGRFFVPPEQKIKDFGQEQLLLHATVEELVRHDLALRENADDGRYLVFPSQFNRDYEDAPEPKGKTVAITFEGPVQSLYSTLAVRLGHSGLFTIGRAEMWRNAAVFSAKAGGKCGLFLQEFAEARGRLILFFDENASAETRFDFEEFILAHTKRRALDDTVELVRFFVCSNGHPVPHDYVELLRAQGKSTFECPCGKPVALAEPKKRLLFESKVGAMDRSANRQRNFDAFLVSAKGETSTATFQAWAGGDRVTLAIVFTDVIGSTAIGEEIRDEAMQRVRRAHFAQSRELIGMFRGHEIKTIGDGFMAAFKSAEAALDYVRIFRWNTGNPSVRIRAGIHIGPIHVDENDVFGGTVNFAARVVGAIKDAEIWLSDRAKEDIDRLGAEKHKDLKWQRHDGVEMKGFPGTFTLWQLKS